MARGRALDLQEAQKDVSGGRQIKAVYQSPSGIRKVAV